MIDVINVLFWRYFDVLKHFPAFIFKQHCFLRLFVC